MEKFDFNSLLYILSASTESDESLHRALILHNYYRSQEKLILLNFKDQCKGLYSNISLKVLKKTAKNIFKPDLSVNWFESEISRIQIWSDNHNIVTRGTISFEISIDITKLYSKLLSFGV